MFKNIYAIDLGTDNTIIYAPNKGIIYNEPTTISINNKTNQILAIGREAKDMVGKNHNNISVISPLKNGAISNLEATSMMVGHLVDKFMKHRFFKPSIAVSIPFDLSIYERKAVYESGVNAGAKKVLMIEDPYSAGVGSNIDILSPKGAVILDFGSGVVEVSLLSCASVVASKSIRFASKDIEVSIIEYLKDKYRVSISSKDAESLKMMLSNIDYTKENYIQINAKNLVNGMPQKILFNINDLKSVVYANINKIINLVKNFIQSIPVEFVSHVYDNGIYLTGGGSLLGGFSEYMEKELKIKTNLTQNPLLNIAIGAGRIVEDKYYYNSFFNKR